MDRASYTFVLELTTTAPLCHGAGSEGNEQIFRTTDALVPVRDTEGAIVEYDRVAIPVVSGSAFKATLREHAVWDQFEILGIKEGDVSLDGLRLLQKGGKNDSGGASMGLEKARALRAAFPLIAVFGAMDGGMPLPGAIQVSHVTPYTQSAVAAGKIPSVVRPLHIDGDSPPEVAVFTDRPPVPDEFVMTSETFYRHDLKQSTTSRMLGVAAQEAIEDKAGARKALPAKAATKDVRREANESMPHSMEAIATGVPMFAQIRLNNVTSVERTCFVRALQRWIASGAQLGGALSKGHGTCSVRVAGHFTHDPGTAHAALGTAIVDPNNLAAAFNAEFIAHVQAHADEARRVAGEVTR